MVPRWIQNLASGEPRRVAARAIGSASRSRPLRCSAQARASATWTLVRWRHSARAWLSARSGDAVVGLEERGLEVGAYAARVEELDRGADDRELGVGLVGPAEVDEQLAELGEVLRERLAGDDVLPGRHGPLEVAARGLQAGAGDERGQVVRHGLAGRWRGRGAAAGEPALLALDVGGRVSV